MPRYPDRDTAFALLKRLRSFATPVIHFNTSDPRPLSTQIRELIEYQDVYDKGVCRALQINSPWPDGDDLRSLRDAFPDLSMILQISLWREENQDPTTLRSRLEPYCGVVQHLLLDPSGGRGRALEPRLLELAAEVERSFPTFFSLGIAGGLTGETVGAVIDCTARILGHRRFSMDTEGKVRGGVHQGRRVGDTVNLDKVSAYLRAVVSAIEVS